ncbi:MobC family plasmid mobilization relaxosome protein [Mucilaginibacter sp. UC70_90]|uniref:MobC family plasmid mobilization relaxosome protein n=1 Tax=Mucilaginibacter sp. 14171R-50 TaxID=2703789 RepID=UPI001EE3CD64|nr:MobC family plasmid mobilization relaxosome protein [Mucilaginibacter sp. 14171R-50]
MGETHENRSKWVKIRLKPTEQNLIERRYKKTTFQCMSEYARALLLGKPVMILNRDKSLDDLLEELMILRKELNAIGNNLNQAVRNINSAHGTADNRLWENLLQVVNNKLEPSVTEIKDRINTYATLWSQKLKAGKV